MQDQIMTSTRLFIQNALQWAGRTTRQEYWWPTAIIIVSYLILNSLRMNLPAILAIVPWLVMVALFIPFLSGSIRRLRDAGFSPWLALLVLLPGIGALILLVLCSFPTNSIGKNNYRS